MKKVVSIVLTIVFALSISTSALAAGKTSPTSGYKVVVTGSSNDNNVAYYAKPNGKKLGTILSVFNLDSGWGDPDFNEVVVQKFVDANWVQVKLAKTGKGAKNYSAYMKTKDLAASGFDESVVVKIKKAALYEKKSVKSKVIVNIPRGTKMNIDYSKERYNKKWATVIYYKNGKKYEGYILKKNTI